MFDVGFWELGLIALVALVVIGPERLPSVARTTGAWMGKLRRFVTQVKDEVNSELKADELKRILEQQKNSIASHDIIEKTQHTINDLEQKARSLADQANPTSFETNESDVDKEIDKK